MLEKYLQIHSPECLKQHPGVSSALDEELLGNTRIALHILRCAIPSAKPFVRNMDMSFGEIFCRIAEDFQRRSKICTKINEE